MKAHAMDVVAQMNGAPEMKAGRCSYCGSMSVEEALELLKTRGTEYTGCDWAYGWPHQFRLNGRKFYSVHLRDATDEQLAAWNLVAKPLLGIGFAETAPRLVRAVRERLPTRPAPSVLLPVAGLACGSGVWLAAVLTG